MIALNEDGPEAVEPMPGFANTACRSINNFLVMAWCSAKTDIVCGTRVPVQAANITAMELATSPAA